MWGDEKVENVLILSPSLGVTVGIGVRVHANIIGSILHWIFKNLEGSMFNLSDLSTSYC